MEDMVFFFSLFVLQLKKTEIWEMLFQPWTERLSVIKKLVVLLLPPNI